MAKLLPILMLCGSNLFMTVAWYGHLKFKDTALWIVILLSWCIALPEYALQVPANRWGHGAWTAPQLKVIQEAISMTVFVILSIAYLKEWPRPRDYAGFALIGLGLAIALSGRAEAVK